MNRAAAITFSLLAILSLAAAQEKTQVRKVETHAKSAAEAKSTLTKDQQRQLKQLLDSAETGTSDLDPASRIAALIELAQVYRITDKAKAVELLETALASIRNLPADSSNRNAHQVQNIVEPNAIRELASLAPERLDALMASMSPASRSTALSMMLPYYDRTNQLTRAYELLMRTANESRMPYDTASSLMNLLERDRPDEMRSLFVSSLTSYENDDSEGFRSMGDFPEMVGQFHAKLPNELVQLAIDAVLDRAKKQDEKADGWTISLASASGAASFQSMYDYRLFQLLPILQEVDPGRAERLIKERQDVKTLLAKYPEGLNSIQSSKDKQRGMFSMTMGPGSNSGAAGSGGQTSILEQQRASQIISDAEKHPQDALANAALLSPMMAMQAYVGIARANANKDTAATRMALGKASDLIENLPLQDQMMNIRSVSSLYLQINDKENAKSALEKGLVFVGRLYKLDIDADDPNTAPKAFWASTSGWRAMVATAAKTDQRWAMSLLNEIPDDGVRVFIRITVAKSIVGVAPSGFYVMNGTKKSGGMSFIGEEN